MGKPCPRSQARTQIQAFGAPNTRFSARTLSRSWSKAAGEGYTRTPAMFVSCQLPSADPLPRNPHPLWPDHPIPAAESLVPKPQPVLKTAFQGRVLILPQDSLPEPNLINKRRERHFNKGSSTHSQACPLEQEAVFSQSRLVSLPPSKSSGHQPEGELMRARVLSPGSSLWKNTISTAYRKHAVNH